MTGKNNTNSNACMKNDSLEENSPKKISKQYNVFMAKNGEAIQDLPDVSANLLRHKIHQ